MEGSAPGSAAPAAAPNQPQGSGASPSEKPPSGGDSPFSEASEPKEPKEPAPPPKKYKVKDGDEELEVEEAELLKGYQRARSANKKFEEAAQARKQVESILSSMKQNPIAVLQKLGIDPRQVSEGYLKGIIEDEMLQQQDPHAYELRKRQLQLESREEKLKKFEEQQKQQHFEQAKSQASQRYEKKFMAALETSGLPKSAFTVKRMAEYERQAQRSGYDLTHEELGSLVKEDVLREVKEMMGAGDPLALLGDDIAAKFRQADLARLQSPRVQAPQPGAQASRPKEKKWITDSEWKEEIKRINQRG